MANYAPIIIKNGEMQQLQAADTLAVPTLIVTGPSAGGIHTATVDTDPTGIARFQLTEGVTVKGVLQYIGSTFGTTTLRNLMTMGSIGTTPIGFVWNSVERMRLQTGLNIGGTTDPAQGGAQLYLTGASGAAAILGLHPDGFDSNAAGFTLIAALTASYITEYRAVPIIFSCFNGERMRLAFGLNIGDVADPGAGNLALDVSAISPALDPGYRGVLWGTAGIFAQPTPNIANTLVLANGATFSAGAWAYNLINAVPSRYYQLRGDHVWSTAPISATLPANITGWVDTLKLFASGGLNLGAGVTDPGAGNFRINGIINFYNGVALATPGIATLVGARDIAPRGSGFGPVTLATPAATGFFRISVTLKITTVGTSPVIGPVVIAYTAGDDSVAQSHTMALVTTAGAVQTTATGNSTTTSTVSGELMIHALVGVAITVQILGSGVFGAGLWAGHVRCEAL